MFKSHFNLPFMLCVNVLTYLLVNMIDDLNGDKPIGTWTKRLVMIISCIAVAIGYTVGGYNDTIILINSSIVAPVSWSWIFKPIFKKIGIDYKNKPKK